MKILLSITFLALCTIVFSQNNNPDSASCIAFWEKGESKIFHIVHEKTSSENGKLKSQFSLAYEAHVTVIDSSTENYTIQWIFHLSDSVKKANPGLADLSPVYEGLKMIYKTSQTGVFVELMNWREVKDAYVKMMELSIRKELDSVGKAALEQSKAFFNSKEMVEAALIREIQLFHLPYGYQFSTTEIKEKGELPNPFGGDPLPALHTYKITELRPKQDYFNLVVTQYIDKMGSKKIIEDVFKRMGVQNDSSIVEVEKILNTLEIKDESEYHIIYSTGWPKKIKFTRTAHTGQMHQTDTYIVEMKN